MSLFPRLMRKQHQTANLGTSAKPIANLRMISRRLLKSPHQNQMFLSRIYSRAHQKAELDFSAQLELMRRLQRQIYLEQQLQRDLLVLCLNLLILELLETKNSKIQSLLMRTSRHQSAKAEQQENSTPLELIFLLD